MLGKTTDITDRKFDEETTKQQASKLDKLCPMRWTVHAESFRKIKEKYQALLQLLRNNLDEELDIETKPRIIGCKQLLLLWIKSVPEAL